MPETGGQPSELALSAKALVCFVSTKTRLLCLHPNEAQSLGQQSFWGTWGQEGSTVSS